MNHSLIVEKLETHSSQSQNKLLDTNYIQIDPIRRESKRTGTTKKLRWSPCTSLLSSVAASVGAAVGFMSPGPMLLSDQAGHVYLISNLWLSHRNDHRHLPSTTVKQSERFRHGRSALPTIRTTWRTVPVTRHVGL